MVVQFQPLLLEVSSVIVKSVAALIDRKHTVDIRS